MQCYARRVREIHLTDNRPDPPKIAPSVWTFLARWVPPEQGLLPRLRRLEGLIVADADPGNILLFSPTLRHLGLTEDGCLYASLLWTSHVIVAVAERTVYPHLESLRVDSNRFLFGPGPISSYISAHLVHLRELDITEPVLVEAPFIQALATLRELHTLSIRPYVRALEGYRAPRDAFDALRHLTLKGDALSLRRFLRATAPRHLASFKLHIVEWFRCSDASAVRHVHAALAHVPSSSWKAIPTLSVTLQGGASPRVAPLLAPTRAFRWLTRVHVTLESCTAELVVSAAELLAFAAAWPDLVVFELALARCDIGNEISRVPDAPTARTLLALVARLPRLERLTIPYISLVDAEIPDAYALFPVDEHEYGGLTALRVCVVNDGDWGDTALRREFAIFVDRLFPNLDLDDESTSASCPWNERVEWHEIQEIVRTLRAGRELAREAKRRRKLQRRQEVGFLER